MVHELKIEPVYFEFKLNGSKPWEIRKNDRDYNEGDLLCLREFDGTGYTGREIIQTVNDVFKDSRFLKKGFVLMWGDIVMFTECNDGI